MVINGVSKIEKLLASSQNVFTTQDLAVIWEMIDPVLLYARIQYYVQQGKLQRLHKGVYGVRGHEPEELAQKVVTPSYISLQSALAAHGIVFQYYQGVRSMALVSKVVWVGGMKLVFHKLKEAVFYNSLGLENRGNYLMAGPERAVADSLYLFSGLAFDNLQGLNFDLLEELSHIYHNRRLEKEIISLIQKEKGDA